MELSLYRVEVLQREGDVQQASGDLHLGDGRTRLKEAGVFRRAAWNVLEVVENVRQRTDDALSSERDAVLGVLDHLD